MVDKIQNLTIDYNLKQTKFLKRVIDNFDGIKITNQLDSFDELDFRKFINELSKQKIKLSLTRQDEWEDYFNTYKSDLKNIKVDIDKLDNEINEIVFKLYDLSSVEIKILEESV